MSIPYAELDPLDKWALARTSDLINEVGDAYENVEIHKVYQAVTRFCSVTLSSNYHDILKDRLYTLAPCDPLRRSSQTAIHEIFQALITVLAPVLPFTTDEAWAYYQNDEELCDDPLLLQDWKEFPDAWQSNEEAAEIEALLEFKSNYINEKLEAIRESKEIGQSLDAEIRICANEENKVFQLLKKYESSLAELFIVSSVILEETQSPELAVTANHAPGVRCPRSWRWVSELVDTGNWGEVSHRCHKTFKRIKEATTDQI